MFKLLNFVIISFLLLTTYAFAQSIFDQPPTNPTQPSTKPGGSMSPSDFKSAVTQKSQQIKNGLNQQAKQLYPKTPPATGAQPPGTQPTPVQQQPAAPATVDNSFSVGPPAKTQPGAGAIPPAPNQPTDGYTGFGGGNSGGTKSNKSNAPASSGNSGGWNINY